jgi:hypothetical protein
MAARPSGAKRHRGRPLNSIVRCLQEHAAAEANLPMDYRAVFCVRRDVVVWLNVSVELALRMLGVLTIAGGVVQMRERKIAYGWEGHEPSGYITGVPAFVLSAVLVAVGVVLLVAPQLAMPFFAPKQA